MEKWLIGIGIGILVLVLTGLQGCYGCGCGGYSQGYHDAEMRRMYEENRKAQLQLTEMTAKMEAEKSNKDKDEQDVAGSAAVLGLGLNKGLAHQGQPAGHKSLTCVGGKSGASSSSKSGPGKQGSSGTGIPGLPVGLPGGF